MPSLLKRDLTVSFDRQRFFRLSNENVLQTVRTVVDQHDINAIQVTEKDCYITTCKKVYSVERVNWELRLYSLNIFQISVYSCEVCLDYTTKAWYAIDRHVMEQHSGFGYRCDGCHKVFSRSNQKHQRCSQDEKGVEMPVFNRLTGTCSREAEKEYEEVKRFTLDKIKLVKKSVSRVTLSQISQSHKRKHVDNRNVNNKHSEQSKKVQLCDETEEPKVPKKQKNVNLSLKVKEFTLVDPPISPLPVVSKETESELNTWIVSDNDTNIMESPPSATCQKDVVSIFADDDELNSIKPRPSTPAPDEGLTIKSNSNIVCGYDSHSKIVEAMQHQKDEKVPLEIGWQRFACSRVSLNTDPSYLSAVITFKVTEVRPLKEGGVPTYFVDWDPIHFRHILNYLRNGGTAIMSTLPKERRF